MKTTSKREKADAVKAADQQPANDDRMVILVRRGALRRFDALKQKTAELPVVVSWDRRQADRRRAAAAASAERRNSDRRKGAPFTWELADFVVVPGDTSAGSASFAEEGREPAKPKSTTTTARTRASARKPKLKAVRRKSARTR